MMGKKYKEKFLKTVSYSEYNSVLERIVDVEESTGVSILSWNEKEIGEYLKSFKSVSPLSLNRQMTYLRYYADYVCEQEGLPKRTYKLDDEEDSLYNYIDKEKLLSITLNEQQYRHIVNQLENPRDRLLMSLAWYGLSTDNIKYLKTEDISFQYSKAYGTEIAVLNTGENTIDIIDTDVIEDLKLCEIENNYVISAKDGRVKTMSFRDSKYLIKPINVGKTKKEDYLCYPTNTLQKIFIAKEITCEGIDVSSLTIEDIRRSGLVFLLSPENHNDFSLDVITLLYGLKNDSSLYWLRQLARDKYNITT